MKQLLTQGIVLSRTNYGEADRIVTLLTPEHGKLRLMARGVRKIKSKLAGGIELFSVSDVTYIRGKGEIGTLVSTRLDKHYGTIIQDIDRVQLGYELIKQVNKATEDQPEAAYFSLLEQSFQVLDDPAIDPGLIRLWFEAQLLRLSGHAPNLHSDIAGRKLDQQATYTFDFDDVAFAINPNGTFTAGHIKALRLMFSSHEPHVIGQVHGIAAILPDIAPLVRAMLTSYIRL